jgi:KDO2-lipid IV(A) lauroyltransferase
MSPLLKARHLAEYLLLRGVIALVRALPLDTATSWSANTWAFIAPKTRRHKRALANLEMAFPEKSPQERERIAREMWANLGRVMAETMRLDHILDEPERVEVENPQLLERYRGRMGPAICASMHMGNWELAMMPLTRAEAKPAAVYRLVDNPYVDLYLRSQREKLYPGGLFSRGAQSGYATARVIGSYVRQGGRLGFLADRFDRTGIPVPFFGHPAKSNSVPAMLARRLGARLWLGRCVRVGTGSHFKVLVKELKVPRTDDAEADIRWIVEQTQAQFEAWIREHPEQWMWSNRRYS